jgi:tetratricopeptide (TPR) repeat protein
MNKLHFERRIGPGLFTRYLSFNMTHLCQMMIFYSFPIWSKMEYGSEQLLALAISKSIQTFSYENAQFLAERLLAIDPTSVSHLFLLAKTHYLQQNYKFAYFLLDTIEHGPSVLLYAECCLKLLKLENGVLALRKWISTSIDRTDNNNDQNSSSNRISPTDQNNSSDKCDLGLLSAAYCLLGKIERRVGRVEQARLALQSCVEIDPLNWTAYKLLAEIGKWSFVFMFYRVFLMELAKLGLILTAILIIYRF